MISSLVTGDGTIHLFINKFSYTISPSSDFYDKIKGGMKSNDENALIKLCDLDAAFKARSGGKISYDAGIIKYNGQVINNALTKRIFELDKLDFNFKPLLAFLENILQNPDNDVVDRLYAFLEHQCILIDNDGYVVGYKKVDNEGWDFHSHTIQYKVGGTFGELRVKCDKNPSNDCSHGLHIGSQDYAKSFHGGSGKIIVCRTHPKDVVSVPYDCGSAKLRTCKLEVIAEWQDQRPFNYLDEEISGVTPQKEEALVEESFTDAPGGLKESQIISSITNFMAHSLWETDFSWNSCSKEIVCDYICSNEHKEVQDFLFTNYGLDINLDRNDFLTFNDILKMILETPHTQQTPQRDSNGRFLPRVSKSNIPAHSISNAPKRDANGRFVKSIKSIKNKWRIYY